MGVFDQSARFATLADGGPVLARVLRGEMVKLHLREWLDSRTSPLPGETDRTADKVAALEDGRSAARPWLMLFEFQSRHDEDKLDVTLAEAARLRIEVRHGEDRKDKYQIGVGMVYLRGICPEATIDMTLPSGRGTRHMAFVWDVEADAAETALAEFESGRTTWGILFWIPLMLGGGKKEVIHARLRLVALVEQESRRAALAQIALIFAELAGCRRAWQDALEEANMRTESQVVNEWIEQAEVRTKFVVSRKKLIQLLRGRFPGQVTMAVIDTINQQPSLDLLDSWFEEAIVASTYGDFVAVLRR